MKLFPAIALLGTFRQASATHTDYYNDDYYWSNLGRYELLIQSADIVSTDPGLSGNFEIRTKEFIGYSIDYYDMVGVATPSTCLDGTYVQSDVKLAEDGSETYFFETFDLPVGIWNGGNTASICARVTSTYDGENIDLVEVLATVTRSFSGDFELSVATRTKDATSFASLGNQNFIDVDPFLCDDFGSPISNQELAFAQGQDFQICVEPTSYNYEIVALKDVQCYYGGVESDILVDASGNEQGLTDLETYSSRLMAVKGVVKGLYFADGNTELFCTGDVELASAVTASPTDSNSYSGSYGSSWTRRLEAKKNVRFTYDARAMQRTRDLQEDEAKFSVGIKLDPGSSSAASVSNGVTLMGMMAAAAGIVIALI